MCPTGVSCALRMLDGLASSGYLGPIESTSIDSVPPYEETDFMNNVFERVLQRADIPPTIHLAFARVSTIAQLLSGDP